MPADPSMTSCSTPCSRSSWLTMLVRPLTSAIRLSTGNKNVITFQLQQYAVYFIKVFTMRIFKHAQKRMKIWWTPICPWPQPNNHEDVCQICIVFFSLLFKINDRHLVMLLLWSSIHISQENIGYFLTWP